MSLYNKVTKQRLKQYLWLKRELQSQQERILQLEAELSTAGTPRADGMPRSPTQEKGHLEHKIAVKLELEEMLASNVERLTRETLDIERAIQSLECPRQREVLRLRYLEGCSWGDIGRTLHHELRQVYRIHGKALYHLENIKVVSKCQL